MISKRLIIGLTPGLLAVGTMTFAIAQYNSKNLLRVEGSNQFTLTLNADDTPNTLTNSYQNAVTGAVTTDSGYSINLSFVNAKTASNKFVQLAPRGMVYNFGENDEHIMGINGIKYIGTGTVYARTAKGGQPGGAFMNDFVTLTSGSKTTFAPSDFFQIMAGDSGAIIDSLEISYTCDGEGFDIANMAGKYTGICIDGYTYELDIETNGDTTFKTLNKENNITVSGTADMVNASRLRCTFTDLEYVWNVDANKHELSFYSKSGSLADSFGQVSLDRIYNVDDFESYSSTGRGYDSLHGATSNYDMSGLRAHWFSDFYGSASVASPIGGSGWSLMGTDNYLNFYSDGGRNNSKTAAFKGNNNSLRYISMNCLYGVPTAMKGTSLSFWAKGPYGDVNRSTQASGSAIIKAYAYYATPLTPSNHASARTEAEFVIPVGSDWNEYVMQLDPTRTYYGVGFFCKQNATTYTCIDDIKIYSASPYVLYVEPKDYPGGTFKGSFTYKYSIFGSTATYPMVLYTDNDTNKFVRLYINGTQIETTGISYNKRTKELSITTADKKITIDHIKDKKLGTITATLDVPQETLTNVTFGGDIGSGTYSVTNNGNFSLSRPTKFYGCEANTTELATTFKRRYMSGSWQVDTSNADRITQNTEEMASGESSVTIRGWTGGAVALNLGNDFSSPITATHFSYWVYNPSGHDITLRMWVYKAANFGSNSELTSVTAHASSWTFIYVTMDNLSIYNFQIADFTNSGVYLSFDNITIY